MKNAKKRKLRKIVYLRRKILRILKNKRRKRTNTILKTYNKINPENHLLKFLKHKGFFRKANYDKSKGLANIRIPKVFSFSENPNDTIRIIKHLFYYGSEENVKRINFDHSQCEVLDICASTVMDILLLEITKAKKKKRRMINYSGQIPYHGKVKDILIASGILKHLKFPFREDMHSKITKLELLISEPSSIIATKVVDYYEKCFNTQSLALSKEGKSMIGQMVGEIIDNCELHGGYLKKWYALGHYQLNNYGDYGECHLVLFNFGDTIYEALKSNESSCEVLTSLNKLTEKHRQYFDNNWNEENLWTLSALQEGVSRFRHSTKDPDRGNGTIKLINNFQTIGNNRHGETPVMSITSGRTHIYFNDKYQMQTVTKNGEQVSVVAFNKENDLNKPPDSRNVKTLKEFFPGTVISIKFYIDKVYISSIMEGINDEY